MKLQISSTYLCILTERVNRSSRCRELCPLLVTSFQFSSAFPTRICRSDRLSRYRSNGLFDNRRWRLANEWRDVWSWWGGMGWDSGTPPSVVSSSSSSLGGEEGGVWNSSSEKKITGDYCYCIEKLCNIHFSPCHLSLSFSHHHLHLHQYPVEAGALKTTEHSLLTNQRHWKVSHGPSRV